MFRYANFALRFAIEVAGLAALAYWGAGATGSGAANLALAILVPGLATTIWGVWSAPKASHRLSGPALVAAALFAVAIANGIYLGRVEPPGSLSR